MNEKLDNKSEWTAIKLPIGLYNEVTRYLSTYDAYKRGFTSKSSYIVHCVRQELELRGHIKK